MQMIETGIKVHTGQDLEAMAAMTEEVHVIEMDQGMIDTDQDGTTVIALRVIVGLVGEMETDWDQQDQGIEEAMIADKVQEIVNVEIKTIMEEMDQEMTDFDPD